MSNFKNSSPGTRNKTSSEQHEMTADNEVRVPLNPNAKNMELYEV